MKTINHWHRASRSAARALLVTIVMTCGSAVPSHASGQVAEGRTCQATLLAATRDDGLVLDIGSDCVLHVRARDEASVGRLALPRPDAKKRRLRRVIAMPDLLIVLTSHPGRLEVYDLPHVAPIPIIGNVALRVPVDAAVHGAGVGHATLFVVDNAEPRSVLMTDEPCDGARLLRFRLDRHRSSRRDVVVARALQQLDGDGYWGAERQRLESVELDGEELRVSVAEDGQRYSAFLTLDGVLLERERIPNRP
jgi:hypothetical protein